MAIQWDHGKIKLLLLRTLGPFIVFFTLFLTGAFYVNMCGEFAPPKLKLAAGCALTLRTNQDVRWGKWTIKNVSPQYEVTPSQFPYWVSLVGFAEPKKDVVLVFVLWRDEYPSRPLETENEITFYLPVKNQWETTREFLRVLAYVRVNHVFPGISKAQKELIAESQAYAWTSAIRGVSHEIYRIGLQGSAYTVDEHEYTKMLREAQKLRAPLRIP